MQCHERIKLFRQLKGWSQEEIADKLQMSVGGYGAIERGTTDVQLSRLQQIADLFEVELMELFKNEHNVVNANNSNTSINNFGYQHHWHIYSGDESIELRHQLELVEQENRYLKHIIELINK
jgi:transcriptional regulator with XRE-family HTH domain